MSRDTWTKVQEISHTNVTFKLCQSSEGIEAILSVRSYEFTVINALALMSDFNKPSIFAYFHTLRIRIDNTRKKWPFEYWLVISHTLSSLE